MGEIKCYDCKLADDRNNNFCQTCYQNGEAMNYMPKEDDQTAKKDGGKLDLTLVPMAIVEEIAKIREMGVKKYADPDNWKKVSIDRYWKATLRHILAAWNDMLSVDEESGLLHIAHASCNLAFIFELMKEKKCQDSLIYKEINTED